MLCLSLHQEPLTWASTTSASFIKHDPLWYAAKWGVTDKNEDGILDTNEWDVDNNGVPDGYFLVTNAGKLPEQLGKAFAKLLNNVSSASAVAANTTRLDTGTLVYQAKFDPRDWSGQLLALSVDETTGAANTTTPNWDAANYCRQPPAAKFIPTTRQRQQARAGLSLNGKLPLQSQQLSRRI